MAAQAAQNRGDFGAAATCYEEILKLRPDLAEVWANLGLMHRSMGDFQRANRDFEVALRKNPQLYVPNLFLGLDFLQLHQPQQALPYLKRAVEQNSKDEQATLALGQAYESLNHPAEANEWFFQTVETNPKNAEAWYGLGVTYLNLQDSAVVKLRMLDLNSVYARTLAARVFLEQGRGSQAINIYKELLLDQPQPPCLRADLGFAYIQSHSLALAQAAFQEEIKRNPGCLPARLGLALVAIETGDPRGALRELDAAWEADRNFFEANVRRFLNLFNAEQLSQLQDWLKQSQEPLARSGCAQILARSIESWRVNPAPDFVPVRRSKDEGSATNSVPERPRDQSPTSPRDLWAQGHYTECEKSLQAGKAELQPSGSLLLALCSYYSGDYRGSWLASEASLKTDPQSLPALYWKAISAQELAADALARTFLLAPGSRGAHLLLAELYREREEFSAAEAEYTKVIDSGPNDPAAHMGLAHVYYQELKFHEAEAQLKHVLQADPTNPDASLLMGETLVNLHLYAEAPPYLKAALKGSPLSVPQIHSLLARCYAAQGQLREAMVELKPALPADTQGIFHYQLYQLYEKMGDHKNAAAALQESEMLRRKLVEQQQKVIEGNVPKE